MSHDQYANRSTLLDIPGNPVAPVDARHGHRMEANGT